MSHQETTASPDPSRTPDPSGPEVLELWQAEWCPSSRRVRQRLTELGLDYLARQVPAERSRRKGLLAATGRESVPVLVAGGEVIGGEDAILGWLDTNCPETPEAGEHRRKAAMAKRKELEKACQEL